jgi:hypothetical protein
MPAYATVLIILAVLIFGFLGLISIINHRELQKKVDDYWTTELNYWRKKERQMTRLTRRGKILPFPKPGTVLFHRLEQKIAALRTSTRAEEVFNQNMCFLPRICPREYYTTFVQLVTRWYNGRKNHIRTSVWNHYVKELRKRHDLLKQS